MTQMPFGKYQDQELTEIPKQYLRWLRRQPWLGAWLVKEIDLVLSGETETSSDESFEEVLGSTRQERNRAKKIPADSRKIGGAHSK
jgi:putative quorum-sensing-regulated virulence factor